MIDNLTATRPKPRRLLPPLFPLLAIAGLLIALLLYRQTFREATIDLSVDRTAAEQRALAFLATQGVVTGDRWRSASFQTDTNAQDYLIASSGLAELDALSARDLKLASWHVRLFTPLDPEEWSVDVSSRSGRILSYQHTIKEEAPAATVPITTAEQLALQALIARAGGGPQPGELRLLSRRVIRQPNRTDASFTWEQPALRRGDATYRYSVTMYGDQVGSFNEYYNIPESWNRLARWHGRRGALLNLIGWTATYALMGGLGLAWLWAAGRKLLRPCFALTLLAVIGVIGLATALNSIPLVLSTLPTDISVPAYLADQLGSYAGLALILGATVVVAGMAGEALASSAGHGDTRHGDKQTRDTEANVDREISLSPPLPVSLSDLASRPIVRSLLIGICVAVAQLGYITLFYWIGQRWFGVWAPVDPNYDDILSTPLPWLYAMALGLLPAIGEELVFRLGGISLLRRITGMPRLSVVLTSVIWASLHTTYTQQPFFIRLVELTIVGIIFGTLFLRYGVLTSMAAHYTYNAALLAPLLVQGSWATRIGMVVAVGGAALLLLPALLRRLRGLPLEDTETRRHEDTEMGRLGDGEQEISSSPSLPVSVSIPRWLPIVAVAGLALWLLAGWLLPQPALLLRPLTRADVIAQGAATAQRLGLSIDGLYAAAAPDATLLNLDANYLRDHPAAQNVAALVAAQGQRSAWRVSFSQWDRDDRLTLWLDTHGELLALDRGLPEDAPGAAIPQAQARQLAETLLRTQQFNLDSATLVESSTITRTNRVDHRFVWESAQVIGETAHVRMLVAVQGNQIATLSPFLYTPPEYRRERDRTTLPTMLTRDTLPLLPEATALLISCAGLLLATRRPVPLRLIIAVGLVGAGAATLDGVLGLDAAQFAQPARLIQGVAYAIYNAILSGTELALVAGGTVLLWQQAFPGLPRTKSQEPRTSWRTSLLGSQFSVLSSWREGCALGLALLPALLAFAVLRSGLAGDPGAVRSPIGPGSLVPALTVLLEGALSALRTALLLAGATALLSIWRPLRPLALPLVALGATLIATQPDSLPLLLLALLAWPIALVLARRLRGNLVALILALWWAACLPDALELIALGHWWYALNGVLALAVLVTPAALLGLKAQRGMTR